MNKTRVIPIVAGAIIGLIVGFGCKSSTSPKSTPNALVVVQPSAGQTYKVGDTMKIKWQVNDSSEVSSVILELHHDTTILVIGNNSFPPDSTSHSWIVDSSTVSTHCYVKVREYNNSVPPDSSGIFTITK
jgi:hypothetical protein